VSKEIGLRRLILVGRVLGARGVKGEVRVKVISDSPGRFAAGGTLYVGDRPRTIDSSMGLPRGYVGLKLEGIDSRDDAESLRGCSLQVPEEMAPPLPKGQYYHFQIIDLCVYTRLGEYLGRVAEILSTGSNDVYIVDHEGRQLLIPALEGVIEEVDVVRGVMTVDLPDGLRPGP
jgi:16S rRNA processing protein RimM